MNFEEWYAQLGKWAEEYTARNTLSYAMQRHLAECLSKWQAAQQPLALDAAYRNCPNCNAMLEEHSVYCDTCGTDTPRQ